MEKFTQALKKLHNRWLVALVVTFCMSEIALFSDIFALCKRDAENLILNILGEAALAIFSTFKTPAGTCL